MEYRNFELARHSTRSLNVELLKRVRNTYIVVIVDNTHAMLFIVVIVVVVVVVVIQGLSYDECLRSDHVDNVHGIMLLLLLLLLLLLYRSYLIR